MYSRTPGVTAEVAPDVFLRGVPLDAELAREAESRHAVDQPEVDRLRGAALVVRHLVRRDVEYFCRRRAMNVAFLGEGAPQALIARKMRHDPQLDLRIIRGEQHMTLRRDEGLADAPALRRPDRDVLQVRVAG